MFRGDLAHGFDAVELTLARASRHRERRELERAQSDVRQPVLRALLVLGVTNGVAASGSAPRASSARCALKGMALTMPSG
jgi:hypothetical protein